MSKICEEDQLRAAYINLNIAVNYNKEYFNMKKWKEQKIELVCRRYELLYYH